MSNSSMIADHVRSVYSAVSGGSRDHQDLVSRSWARCLEDYGLDPGRSTEPRVLDAAQMKDRVVRMDDLLSCAKLEMANLYQQLADNELAVLLTDTEGVVLSVVGDPGFTRSAARHGMREGAVWSEPEQGTNGMGTCLVEKSPLVIHRDQHFLARNIQFTCTAAPILDASGELAAVLDVSSQSRLLQQYSTVLVGMAATTIENRMLLARHRRDHLVRFHSRPEFVYTLHEGELALSAEGRVLAANRSALLQLGLTRFDEILGCDIRQLFNVALPDLVGRSVRSSFHPVTVYGARRGSRFFAVAQPPQRNAHAAREVAERPALARAPAAEPDGGARLAGLEFGDPRMAANVHRALRVVDRGIPVLLAGETGTGKELFARAFHAASQRAAGPFVALNCAAIPESLIESELFGYKSGAFTGANREGRRGKILQANGGTLFLDEIGDMPYNLQARLLRVLEEREVVPLGGEAPVAVDIQLVSATHRHLEDMVARGEFREDLYYRLQGITLNLPPLRERADLRQIIVQAVRDEACGREVSIDDAALRALESHAWPGNIRQLRTVLRTALALAEEDRITLRDLPEELTRARKTREEHDASGPALNPLQSAERDALLSELERCQWNVTLVAQKLNTSRNTIYRKMKRLDIRTVSSERPA
ncbi:MAG TPA: sigma-54-dependent Fis family transcriptional regulator [Burkholderiales bacterium]|nr:sigma-54-dependent Fis family transcriptional regulator [Burkholderiales bacterium]